MLALHAVELEGSEDHLNRLLELLLLGRGKLSGIFSFVMKPFIANLQRRSGVWWKDNMLCVSGEEGGLFYNGVFLIPLPSHESFLLLHPRQWFLL